MWGSSGKAIWSPRGDLLAFIAVGLFATYFILAKSARQEVPALEFQTALWIVGTVVLAPVAVIDAGGLEWPSARDWAWLAALLAVPGTGHGRTTVPETGADLRNRTGAAAARSASAT